MDDLLNKTLFPFALACANRASEIAAIQRNSVCHRDEERALVMAVKPGFIYKSQRLNRCPPNIVIRTLNSASKDICPVVYLREYLQRSGKTNEG